MKQLKGVYFYNGFNKPEKLANDLDELTNDLKNKDTILTTNYLGDITSNLLDELADVLKDDRAKDDDINNVLYSYSLFYNPTLENFQNININRYGLEKNEYLTEFIK